MTETHPIITDSQALAALCEHLSRVDCIAIDTEFMRERTYYPKLCLMQVADGKGAWLIDPLAGGIDLAPFVALLANPRVLKVFHAARQDLEIFYHLSGGRLPNNVFDTQVAAQVLGFGESIGYGELMNKVLGVQIDKGSRFTDWSKRPLSERQVIYAADDVIHLREAYTIMHARLQKENRLEWIDSDMAELLDPAIYAAEPAEAWKRVKSGNLKPQQLCVLKEVAAWREMEAQRKDIPRGRLIKDETLVQVAHAMPRDEEALSHIRGIDRNASKVNHAILASVHYALSLPKDSWPQISSRKSPPSYVADAVSLLHLLLQRQCREHGVLARLVATRDELDSFAQGEMDVRFMQGWRVPIFGEPALELMAGKIAFQWDPHAKQFSLIRSQTVFKVSTENGNQ